ncbi:MAG TPA: hypothetical protein VGF86_03980 [Candidatus Tumulicola sp.]|jgi:hypothetical protein
MGFRRYDLAALVLLAQLVACNGTQPASPLPAQPDVFAGNSPPAGEKFLGCPYPSGDVWTTDVTHAPLSPNSAANIKATVDARGGGFFTAAANPTSEYVNQANSSTPLHVVRPLSPDHVPKSPEAWKFSPPFYVEPFSDAHAMVLRTDICHLYETYGTVADARTHTLSAISGEFVDLTKPFVRPSRGACSTATCIPLALLAIRPEELRAGVVRHALGWDAVQHSLSLAACVSPAAQTHCTDRLRYDGPPGEASYAMPYGAHIRLRASFDNSAFPLEARIVAEALKHYGAYLFDTGCCNTIPFVNDVNGSPRWTPADDAALKKIQLDSFDVVQPP